MPADGAEGADPVLLDESAEELYEQAPCGYVSIFADGTFARVNHTFLAWTGYTREDLLVGRRWQDLLDVGDRIFYETHCLPLLHMQGFVHEIALELRCKDGHRLPVLVNAVEKRDASGTPLLHRITVFNATDRRRYERELLRSQREAETAAQRLGRLLAITTAFAKALTQQQVAEILTEQGTLALNAQSGLVALLRPDRRALADVYSVGYPSEVLEHWRQSSLDASLPITDAVRTGQPVLIETAEMFAALYPHVAVHFVALGMQSLAAIPLSVNGEANGVLAIGFAAPQAFTADDRTFLLMLGRQCALALERARLYEAEQVARAEAQQAVYTRDTFFSVAAHELKNPLTALLGNAQLLRRRVARDGVLSERSQRMLDVIVDQAARLNTMIADMLDVGRIASGQLIITCTDVDIVALTRRVVAELQPTLTNHILSYEGQTGALTVVGDALRLEQVLHNLIRNAVKYSPFGGHITVQIEERAPMVDVAVTDQGIGIAQEALPQLFQRFYRAAHRDTMGIEGMGIGLYVVKEIVTLHGGMIQVASQEGVGSTFTISLRLVT